MSSTSSGTAKWGCTFVLAFSTESASTTSNVSPCHLALFLHDQSPHVACVHEAQERPSDCKRGRCTEAPSHHHPLRLLPPHRARHTHRLLRQLAQGAPDHPDADLRPNRLLCLVLRGLPVDNIPRRCGYGRHHARWCHVPALAIMRLNVSHLSFGILGLIGLFFAIAIVCLIFYIIAVIVAPPGIWIFTKPFADVSYVSLAQCLPFVCAFSESALMCPACTWRSAPHHRSSPSSRCGNRTYPKRRGNKSEKCRAATSSANSDNSFSPTPCIEEVID